MRSVRAKSLSTVEILLAMEMREKKLEEDRVLIKKPRITPSVLSSTL